MKIKIYYHHTDCGGVVYYARYLDFLEEARTDFFDQRGISVKELTRKGTLFVVAHQEIDYKAPAFYGDVLKIDTRVAEVGRAKIDFTYEIKNQDGGLVATAKTTLVCVDSKLKSQAIPEEVRQKITR